MNTLWLSLYFFRYLLSKICAERPFWKINVRNKKIGYTLQYQYDIADSSVSSLCSFEIDFRRQYLHRDLWSISIFIFYLYFALNLENLRQSRYSSWIESLSSLHLLQSQRESDISIYNTCRLSGSFPGKRGAYICPPRFLLTQPFSTLLQIHSIILMHIPRSIFVRKFFYIL